jgi:hypothetical protein
MQLIQRSARMKYVLALALFFTSLGDPGAALALETAEEIEDCVHENLPEESSLQRIVFKARDRIGAVKESRATIYWKKFPDGFSKALMRVSAPPKLRGTGLLLLEKKNSTDRFLYLPELRKVRRITKNSSSESILGTDFTYDELERVQGMREDRQSERLEDAIIEGRPVYVLQSRPAADEDAEFDRAVTFIDRQSCVVLREEFYERGNQLRKLLTADPDRITREGALHIPRLMLMQDLLEETSTELVLEKIEIDKQIPDRTFSRKELAVGRR